MMAIQTACPHCESQYRLAPAQAGKRVRCKGCGETFLVGVGGKQEEDVPTLEEADEDDEAIEELPVLEEVLEEAAPARGSGSGVRKGVADRSFGSSGHRGRAGKEQEEEEEEGITSRRPSRGFSKDDEEEKDEDRERPVRRRRLVDDDDDEGEDEGTSGGGGVAVILGAVIGVVLLLAVGGGLAYFFMSSRPAGNNQQQAQNPPIDPFPPDNDDKGKPPPVVDDKGKQPGVVIPPPPPRSSKPTDLASALKFLQDTESSRKRAGLAWLSANSVDESKRDEVARALDPLLTDRALRREAVRAVSLWGGKSNIDNLIPLLDEFDSSLWQPAVLVLARFPDEDRVREALARQLAVRGRASFVRQSLEKWPSGNKAEKLVVKHLHHPEEPTRAEVGLLLAKWETDIDLLLEQTLTDLDSANQNTRRSACEWLSKQEAHADKQERIARVLDGLAKDSRDILLREAAVKALEVWATKDNLQTLVMLLGDARMRPRAVSILGKLKAEASIEPLSLVLASAERKEIAKILISFGSKAEKALHIHLAKQRDDEARKTAWQILGEIGTKDSLPVMTNPKFSRKDPVESAAAIKKVRERIAAAASSSSEKKK